MLRDEGREIMLETFRDLDVLEDFNKLPYGKAGRSEGT